MGIADDIKNTAQDLTGKAKEAAGKATDNDRLEAEGKKDQAAAGVKKVGQDVKDTLTGDKWSATRLLRVAPAGPRTAL